jgi:hypothetical protein
MRHEVTLVSTPMDAYTLFTVNIDLRFPCGFGPLSEKPKAFHFSLAPVMHTQHPLGLSNLLPSLSLSQLNSNFALII